MAIAPNTLVAVPRRVPDNYVPINEAAREIGVSVETLYRWINQRRLRRMRVPGDRRTFVIREELERAAEPQEG